MLIGIRDKLTASRAYVAGGFPSASGKTNLAMMVPPRPSTGARGRVSGDDVA
jgi:phosphoenolpyruvate carboxykinase (GTP)